LEAEGYLVTTLHDGASAVDHVAGGAGVDLLVCDLSMPGVNGIEVIRAVRRLLPGLPAILLTGFAGDEAAIGDLASDKEAGLFAVLRKPIAGPFLAGRIEAMLATTVEAEA
jgi:CheY-like chemotaxis protein